MLASSGHIHEIPFGDMMYTRFYHMTFTFDSMTLSTSSAHELFIDKNHVKFTDDPFNSSRDIRILPNNEYLYQFIYLLFIGGKHVTFVEDPTQPLIDITQTFALQMM